MGREPDVLASSILRDPERVAVTPPATTVETVAQSVYFVEKSDKQSLLEHLLADPAMARTLVFTRTKHGADRVVGRLHRAGVDAAAIHANKSQGQRERALDAFRAGRTRVLVATDIAARGIDVDGITHVVNFDLPNVPESYVHRIGRTARAGASGSAVSFCDSLERELLRDIEKNIRMSVPVVDDHPHRSSGAGAAHPASPHHGRAQHRTGEPRPLHGMRRSAHAGPSSFRPRRSRSGGAPRRSR
jgi:ATP-dependent RNA helicase RhlE